MIQRVFIVLFVVPLLLLACKTNQTPATLPPTAVVQPTPAVVATESIPQATTAPPTATAIPPTPTPTEPLAALVNNEPLFLSAYEKELARYEQAQAELGITAAEADPNYRNVVLNALIERELIAQAAAAQNIVVTPAMVEAKLSELRVAAGEPGNFSAWLEVNQWTEEEFRQALQTEMLTEEMVKLVTAEVPTAVEQVRARYIQVDDPVLAQTLLEQIRSGADFAFLAQQNSLDRVTAQNGGDLGFFARGSLLVPEVETAAFSLQPGETSDVIRATSPDGSQATYYLVQVLERDAQRALPADLRYTLLQQALETWLESLWDQAEIVSFVNTGT